MKKLICSAIFALTVLSGVNAQAGVGLSAGAIANLANGNVIVSAIGGGLGVASIIHGVDLVGQGRIGWGVFFLILQEKNMVSTEDAAILSKLDVSVQEQIADISTSNDSSEVKTEKLNALLK